MQGWVKVSNSMGVEPEINLLTGAEEIYTYAAEVVPILWSYACK